MKNTLTFKELLKDSNKIIYQANPSETCDAIDYYEVLKLLQKVREATLIECAQKATITYVNELICNNHTPYMGPCGNCGQYSNSEILVGANLNKESILNLDKNSIQI